MISSIKKKSIFSIIFSNGEKLYSKIFKFFIIKNTDSFKYGVIISKKKGIAVKRNKFKRQVKCILYNLLKKYNVNINIILIPLDINKIKFSILKEDIEKIILKYAINK